MSLTSASAKPTASICLISLYNFTFQDARESFTGVVIPKVLPLMVVKILIKTGLFHLIFRKFTKYSRMSVKDAFDQISDNEEFKTFLSYSFGDLGRFLVNTLSTRDENG